MHKVTFTGAVIDIAFALIAFALTISIERAINITIGAGWWGHAAIFLGFYLGLSILYSLVREPLRWPDQSPGFWWFW